MQLTTILALLPLALAAPTPAAEVQSMMASDSYWTIESFTRTCNEDDSTCHYSFAVNTNEEGVEPQVCAYDVNGSPASRAPYNSLRFGDFTIGSSWSGQFEEGFQTLSVVRDGLIIYPSYQDLQLVDGVTVAPDQSYTPQALP